MKASYRSAHSLRRWSPRRLWRRLGPGLITGASDDDPSGIGTYSQVGARFGYGLLWTLLFSYPMMLAVQDASARIGRVTGKGLAANIRRYYPKPLLYVLVLLMFGANTLNLGADVAAMGAAAQLVFGGHALVYSVLLAVISLGLEILLPYSRYVYFLKWLTLALLAYVATLFTLKIHWPEVLQRTFIPHFSFTSAYLTALLAILGTTISPYLFFWQASEEAEEIEHNHQKPLQQEPQRGRPQIKRIFLDTAVGMGFSNLIAFFIVLTAAATLHDNGIRDIATAAQAAQALEPLAGRHATWLFALGIIGTGLLTVPVLAASAAYAWGEARGWRVSLEARPREAKGFYGVIALSTLLGLAINFVKISPMKALYWTAVINGIVAVPVLWVVMQMATKREIMGAYTLPRSLRYIGWFTTVLMGACALGLLLTAL